MITEQQQKALNTHVEAIHQLLIDRIRSIRLDPSRNAKKHRSIYVRMFGQMLYEAPKLHTGMVSVRLIEHKLRDFSYKACPEHHHSRQKGGAAIVALIDKALQTNTYPTVKNVFDLAVKYCQVHYTTDRENTILKKHQKKCSSEAAYRRSNIQLVYAPELFSKRGHSVQWRKSMTDKYSALIESQTPVLDPQQTFVWPDILR